MDLFLHILERFVIHFGWATFGVLGVTFTLNYLSRRGITWIPDSIKRQLVFAAVCVFAVSALREAFDVYGGQPLIKAVTDYISWASGCGVGVWGLWRFRGLRTT